MKRNIIIGAAILILGAIYIFQETHAPRKTTNAGYHRLISEEFKPAKVSGIQFFQAGKEGKGVRVERDNGNSDSWLVATKFNAPAKKSAIDSLLNNVKTLEGEERASDSKLFPEFGLEEEKGFHLLLSGEAGNELVHLIVGKKAGTYSFGFIRFHDKDTVYIADKDFRYDFGIFTDNDDQEPDQSKWLDMNILSLNKDEVESVSIIGKGKEILIKKKEEEKKEGEDTKEKEAKPHKKRADWILTEGRKKERTIPHDSIDSFLSSIASISALEVVDPSKLSEYGLDNPIEHLVVTAKGNKYSLSLGGQGKGEDKKYYVKKEGKTTLYEISTYTKESTFDKIREIAGGKKEG